ncbi:PID-CTERM protein-sorting domain-containing protein [Algibacter sp. L3A6]|uniref:PID-CTERM protein-sorting domain-containing protein n=1 Tax=Algibacter sp. L3A6 TaxID=2686366 RepID=UPI00131BB580|nr:hypothetical protein [Algibacter sp. L3A6]
MMNNNKKSLVNIIGALAIILAFTFSTNANATSVSAVSTTNVTLATTHFMVVGGGSRCSHGITNCNLRHNDTGSKCRRCRSAHSGKCGGGSTPTDPDSVPLDGGLGFLMLGAAALGVKKLRGKKDAKS